MKTMTFWLVAGVAFFACAPIHAQQTVPSDSASDSAPSLMALAAKLPRATNADVAIGGMTGPVVSFSSKGYILKSNVDYLPRVALTNVSEADFGSLLESKTVYDALTIFGSNPRTIGSSYFEEHLRDIWLNGNSLSQKIQTRMKLLDTMRGYNDSVAAYATSLGFADNASLIEQNATAAEQNDTVMVSNAAQQLASANSRIQFHFARRDLRQANADLDNQTATANGAASMSAAMQQRADNYGKICAQYANELAQHNILVAAEPPFRIIPPLSMRLEVDMDRVAVSLRAQTASSTR